MGVEVGLRLVSSGKEVAIVIDVGVGISGVVGIVEASFVRDILVDVQAAEVRVNSTSEQAMMNVTADETATS